MAEWKRFFKLKKKNSPAGREDVVVDADLAVLLRYESAVLGARQREVGRVTEAVGIRLEPRAGR